MEARFDPRLRDSLKERRRRLAEALDAPSHAPELEDLLQEVDAALSRFDAGTFGLCELCHETIEEDRLRVDPLMRFCLDHLDAAARNALQRDLELAAQVQRALLPRSDLAAAGWEIHYHYDALGPVGGDYCDVLPHADPRGGLLFAVGDVSGKGVAASLLSAHLSAVLRTFTHMGVGVEQMFASANRLFCESTSESHYATLVAGRAGEDGDVEIANAAQGAPMIVRGRTVETTALRGVPLGLFCSAPYAVEHAHLDRGDLLVVYTDGITEARNAQDEEFGPGRLADVLAAGGFDSARSAAHAVLQAIERFRAGAPRGDDATLLVMRRSA